MLRRKESGGTAEALEREYGKLNEKKAVSAMVLPYTIGSRN